jgi:hypothetical protein
MTQEEKQLLLTDLCGRLMYGVKCKVFDFATPYTLSGISPDLYEELYFTQLDFKESDGYAGVKFCKPYLFPMSSMTEEQEMEYDATFATIVYEDGKRDSAMTYKSFDWLNKNHFDYRGLIPMGLANDATWLNVY